MFLKLLMILSFVFAPFAEAETLCTRESKNIDARIEITRAGVGKLIQSITNDQLPNIAQMIKGLRFDDIAFGPEKKNCSADTMKKMTAAEAWDQCFGFPAMLRKNGTKLSDFLKPEPADFHVSDFYLKDIQFGEIKIVPCDDASAKSTHLKDICYDLPIPSLALGGTLDIKSQVNGETMFRMDHWVLNVNALVDNKGNALVPHVKMKAIVSEDGTLKKILQADEFQTKAMVPVGSVSVSMDLSEPELENLSEKILAGVYDDFQATLSLPKVDSSAEKSAYWSTHPDVIRTNKNRFSELTWKQMKLQLGPHFDSEESLALFLLGKIGLDNTNNIIKLSKADGPEMQSLLTKPMEKVSESVTQLAMPIVTKSVNSYMQSLPFLHQELVTTLPALDIQDAIDDAQLANATKQRLEAAKKIAHDIHDASSVRDILESTPSWTDYYSSIREYKNAFAKVRDPSAIHFLAEVERAWSNNLDVLKSKCTELVASKKMSPEELHSIYTQEKEKLELVRKSLKDAEREIVARWNDAIDPMFLRTVAAQIGAANDTIQLAVSMCTLCSAFDTVGSDSNKMPPFKSDKNYDMATQVNFEFINNYLKIQHARKVFDLCIHTHPIDNCSNASWFSINKYAELEDAPRVGRDAQGLYLEGSKLKYGAAFIRFNTEAKSHVDIQPCDNGALCLHLNDLRTGDGRIEEILSLEELNKMLSSSGVILPFDLKAKQVDVNERGLIIYSDVQKTIVPTVFVAKPNK